MNIKKMNPMKDIKQNPVGSKSEAAPETRSETEWRRKVKKILSIASVIIVLILLGFLTWFFCAKFKEISNAESFKDYVLSFGAAGVFVGLGFQLLQVFVALIPGEVIEIGLGYAYGAIRGTLICYAGLFIASTLIFLLVKKFGRKIVLLFVSEESLNGMKFVQKVEQNPEKLKKIMFLLFFIPGTPKDLFTYFFGLMPVSLKEFLWISMLARIPSVISSTIGGMLIHDKKYLLAAVLFAVTAIVSLVGWFGYEKISKHTAAKKDAYENAGDKGH